MGIRMRAGGESGKRDSDYYTQNEDENEEYCGELKVYFLPIRREEKTTTIEITKTILSMRMRWRRLMSMARRAGVRMESVTMINNFSRKCDRECA